MPSVLPVNRKMLVFPANSLKRLLFCTVFVVANGQTSCKANLLDGDGAIAADVTCAETSAPMIRASAIAIRSTGHRPSLSGMLVWQPPTAFESTAAGELDSHKT